MVGTNYTQTGEGETQGYEMTDSFKGKLAAHTRFRIPKR
jgi:hypothetical protein